MGIRVPFKRHQNGFNPDFKSLKPIFPMSMKKLFSKPSKMAERRLKWLQIPTLSFGHQIWKSFSKRILTFFFMKKRTQMTQRRSFSWIDIYTLSKDGKNSQGKNFFFVPKKFLECHPESSREIEKIGFFYESTPKF